MIPTLAIILPGGLAGTAIWIVAALAIVGLVLLAARAFKVPIPEWILQVCWICLAAVVIITAIRFVAGL